MTRGDPGMTRNKGRRKGRLLPAALDAAPGWQERNRLENVSKDLAEIFCKNG
ncbi:hypothetical protein GCM10010245_23150 [Streptomyces spectabilis]|nr:hypothetical protein GCM10010245_23150 [Streptomyces spectabilis]